MGLCVDTKGDKGASWTNDDVIPPTHNISNYPPPYTKTGAVVDARRLAALLSDNLDELNSPLLRIDVAALHLPTGAVLHLPWCVYLREVGTGGCMGG